MSTSGDVHLLPEPEDPRILEANLSVGGRLFISAVSFVFVSFVFGFFYLRAVNSNGNWRPAHVDPTQGYGIAVLVCVLASTAAFEYGRRGIPGRERVRWRGAVALALALALAGVVVQVLQITQAPFGSTGGGYASIFYGWSVIFLLVWLGGLYWVETLLAGTLRGTAATGEPGELSGDPAEVLGPSARACTEYLSALSVVAIVTYLLLYLVK